MNYDPFWRYHEFLDEREKDRLAAQLPGRSPARRWARVRLRAHMAEALLALATWLSPEVLQPTPRFKLARAARRNGTT